VFERLDPVALLQVAGPVLIAFIGGVFATLQGRKKASADANTAIAANYERLVKTLQTERQELGALVDKQQVAIERQSQKIDELEDVIHGLNNHIFRLELAMRSAGVEIPARPNRSP
jgi:hypothetical protein